MASIIEKRLSLHRDLDRQLEKNKQLECQLGQLQALANIGLNTSMIAHEINNLLTPIANYAALALDNPADKQLTDKALNKTALTSKRISEVMQSILSMTKGDSEKRTIFSVRAVVNEIFTCLCRDFSKDQIIVSIDIPEDLKVEGVGIQIQQVLMNLILNAREALLPGGGYLKISAGIKDDTVAITVSDNGCGIDQQNLGKIFDAFFTTKSDKDSAGQTNGTGLGLAFSKKVIESHNGTMTVKSKPGIGSIFTVTLPA